VPTDSETEELLTGALLKGIYGVEPIRISTNANILDPNDTKLGHLRVRLDDAYQASLATRADTDAALALKANQSDLATLGATVATKASQAQMDCWPKLPASGHGLRAPLARAPHMPSGQPVR
jgi:hypothetical protein